ncbi:tyrosine-type recombinase/integrase [Pseudoalteromonas xiamenensis]|uniref:Tyrosine-type recombinase/integrase n=1 Tax=Pseudoalteromonas xiamenensis TaxID=882626 RepID=A0A975DI32_9GAMM|nr:tyrosine-type recombinase/integrase [Pseudoalteromonas xiamenensis]QTH72029.1 tyrosine-type recombinase/integrase [Pseudoalteromonas xiamenensis]
MTRWKGSTGKSHVVLKGKTYYARLTIPKDARDHFDKTEFWQSLRTDSLKEAEYRAAAIVAQWKSQIERVKGNEGLASKALQWKADLEKARRQDELLLRQFHQEHKRRPNIDEANELGIGGFEIVVSDELERIALEQGQQAANTFHNIVYGNNVVTNAHFDEYKATLKVIPRTLSQRSTHLERLAKRFPSLPIKRSDVAKWIVDLEQSGLDISTVKSMMGTCRGYYDYLQRVGYLDFEEVNPFKDQKFMQPKKASKTDQRQAFEPADVIRLIDAAKRKKRPDQNLVDAILIAAYTGMRREEIAQLRVENIKEAEGVKYFEIVEAKTQAGVRNVPIHPKLASLVKRLCATSNDGYLLTREPIRPNGERGDAIGKRFKTLRDSLGFDNRYVFHSLRKTVSTLFERAGVNHNEAAEIVGHEKQGMTYGLYSAGMSMRQKYEIISRIDYG